MRYRPRRERLSRREGWRKFFRPSCAPAAGIILKTYRMTPDRESILQFLSRRRQGGASLRDVLHSLQVPPHERRLTKRLLEQLTRDGLVRRSGAGKFRVADGASGGSGANAARPGARPVPRAEHAPRGNGGDIATADDFGPLPEDDSPPARPEAVEEPAWRAGGIPRSGGGRAGGRGGWRAGGSAGQAHAGKKPAGRAQPLPRAGGEEDTRDWRGMRRGRPKRAPVQTAAGVVTGRFTRNPKGFGFVQPSDRQGTDVFVPPDAIGSALHGDIVDVRVTQVEDDGRRRSGRIVGVRERSRAGIPGRFESRGKSYFVVPDDKRQAGEIFVSRKDAEGARDGDLVLVEVTTPPAKDFFAKGRVLKILGDREDPSIDSDLVIGEFGVQVDFSPGALAEAGAFAEEIGPEERRRRRDLSHVPFVTIDGLTAKDFDDAVSVEDLGEGKVRLYVAIADVAHFVRPGTALDEDASERATSVYLPDRVVPMLPERLSNDLCSLRPNVERLALCAAMDIDARGNVVEYGIDRVVFRSRARMTYEDVHAILIDKRPDLLDRYKPLVPMFHRMHELMKVLRAKRFEQGSIDFDLPEPTIVLDLTGATTDIVKAPRYVSHKIVEEFMLLANVVVAKHFADLDVPLVYRVHDAPDPKRLESINEILGAYGIKLSEKDLQTPHAVGRVLRRFDGKPEEKIINSLMLRAMRQAQYSTDNIGHFGLAFPHYCHFTSPIRRYPDLLVHRATHALLEGTKALARYVDKDARDLGDHALQSSRQERNAMEAERAIIAIKKVRFMRERIGEIYAGHISGVTSFGIFVELDEIFVEGLVKLDQLGRDDQYEFDDKRHVVFGRRSGRTFGLGDPVTVEVVEASLERRAIDFRLARKTG